MTLEGHSDVLVVGAGPAGCAAALVAARAGLRVTMVDRAHFPRGKVCGDALSNRALQTLAELGLGDALSRAPHAVVEGAVALWPDGTPVTRRYGAAQGRIVERYVLDALLREHAEREGVQVHEGVTVRELALREGAVQGAIGKDFSWEARVVIAADGPGSVALAPLAARKPEGRTLAISATAYYEGVQDFVRPGYSEHWFSPALPCGYGWVFPAVRGVSNVGVYLRMDAYRAQGRPLRALLEDFLADHASRFRGAKRVGEVRSWQLPLSDVRAPVGRPGLLTVGDAGRHVDPLTGEGIWQALHTGYRAGEATARALSGRKGALDAGSVRAYRALVAREVDGVAMVRSLVQDGVQQLVARGLYRRAAVQRVMQWGYGSGAMEVSKRVG